MDGLDHYDFLRGGGREGGEGGVMIDRVRTTRNLEKKCRSSLQGRRKKTNRSVNGGWGVNPQSATRIGFLFRKEKKMQNVLKQKYMYFDEKLCEICSFGPVLCFRPFWIFEYTMKYEYDLFFRFG